MLVLSRQSDQKIFIGPDIVITVLDIRNCSRVRLGIQAPDHIQIVRDDAIDSVTHKTAVNPEFLAEDRGSAIDLLQRENETLKRTILEQRTALESRRRKLARVRRALPRNFAWDDDDEDEFKTED